MAFHGFSYSFNVHFTVEKLDLIGYRREYHIDGIPTILKWIGGV